MSKPVSQGDMWRVYAGIGVLPISATDKAVLVVLVDHADSEGRAWPSEPTIAAALGIHIRRIGRSVSNLISASYLKRKRRARTSNIYQIDFDAILRTWDECKQRLEQRRNDRTAMSDHTCINPDRNVRSYPTETSDRPPTETSAYQEQGTRNKDQESNKESRSNEPTSFARWWQVYPRKVARKAAEAIFARIVKKGEATEAELIEGAKLYANQCQTKGTPANYIKHPSTWLNGGCWQDEPDATNELGESICDDGCDDRWAQDRVMPEPNVEASEADVERDVKANLSPKAYAVLLKRGVKLGGIEYDCAVRAERRERGAGWKLLAGCVSDVM